MVDKKTVNLENARLSEQREVMESIVSDGVCPFCVESLRRYHKKPILREGDSWLLTENQWPYENTSEHLLAISKTHSERLADLPKGSGDELLDHMVWAEEKYKVAAGGLAMRFGDISQNGATVRHLHCHFIVPDPERESGARVRFKIS